MAFRILWRVQLQQLSPKVAWKSQHQHERFMLSHPLQSSFAVLRLQKIPSTLKRHRRPHIVTTTWSFTKYSLGIGVDFTNQGLLQWGHSYTSQEDLIHEAFNLLHPHSLIDPVELPLRHRSLLAISHMPIPSLWNQLHLSRLELLVDLPRVSTITTTWSSI